MNQPYIPDWNYPIQYNPYPQYYNQDFQNNFYTSQSQWRITSPESNFQPPCPQFSQNSFPDFGSYTPFPVPPTEEKSDLKRSMEESLQRIQNLLNSHQTPYTLEHPIEEKSELEKSVELFCEIAKQFQNMWDSSP